MPPGAGRRYEVLNLGINGIASYELKMLLPQALSAQPDLVVIYAGHNDCMMRKELFREHQAGRGFEPAEPRPAPVPHLPPGVQSLP